MNVYQINDVAPCSFGILTDNAYGISNGLEDKHIPIHFWYFFAVKAHGSD